MTSTNARLSRLMNELASITDQIGFDAARDAVSAWGDAQADDDQPDWHEVLGSGLRHALTVAEDANTGADMCHIRIDWPVARRAVAFRFDADHGAGPAFGATITAAVANAIAGTE